MTDKLRKRKYAGPPVSDLRKVDQDPARLPPHKKPRVWKLTVEWTETRTVRRERTFTNRAARDEARRRIERHFVERAKVAAERGEKQRKFFSYSDGSPFADFMDQVIHRVTAAPVYTEGVEGGEAEQRRTATRDAPELPF